MKIAVIGIGYVGLSISVLLGRKHFVTAFDIDRHKVENLNNKISPIQDSQIQKFLSENDLNLKATSEKDLAYKDADFVVIATPTNYDEDNQYFDTTSIESTINDVKKYCPEANVIIKSTIPIGYTEKLIESSQLKNIVFSPEFLREGQALLDNLFPSRIIVGGEKELSKDVAKLFKESALKEDVEVILSGHTEAEAIKLFSNTYLAMRVSFFNELDSFAEDKNLNSAEIISGVSLDPRIGNGYNNPSFGYGGYCLPKDTKQLLANFKDTNQALLKAIVDSNSKRKDHVAKKILERNPKIVGIYRLIMKSGSDNFRSSSIHGIIERLKESGVAIKIFEPSFKQENYLGNSVDNDIESFASSVDLIIANRIESKILKFKDKIYTRDIFGVD